MLVTLFHNKPLLNEPGIMENNREIEPYNKIIKYKTVDTAIYKMAVNIHND